MSWTDERVELLRKLWSDGLSASQIAARMGGISRNAVIGKVHRLGLSGRARPARPARPRTAKPRFPSQSNSPRYQVAGNLALRVEPSEMVREALEPEAEPAPVVPIEISPGEHVTILTLTERRCKWPIGDPTDDDFHFCGHESGPGSPYCREHARIAYQPVQDRRKRRRSAGGGSLN